jgi:outer membrane protein
MSVPFDVETPAVDNIPLESVADLQPDLVYKIALTNQPAQKANSLRYQSLVASVKSIKGSLYPRITGFGGLTTRFSNPNKKISNGSITGYSPGPSIVVVGPNTYPVQIPNIAVTTEKVPIGEQWSGWGTQINNFFSQNVGISIAVPIFNGWSARGNYERAKLNIKDADLVIEQSNQKLQQDIYTAYANAMAALEKYNAARSGVLSSQKAYDFSKKRYDLGLLSTFELITAQNNLAKSKIDVSNSQFDFVFKMKVLEFYKGSGIKL